MSFDDDLGSLASLKTADGLFSVDRERRITFWNEQATRLLGYDSDEVVGKKCYEVLCQPGSPGRDACNRECKVFANAGRGRPTRDFDVACTTNDGTQRWLNVTVLFEAPLGKDGKILHMFRDVTDRRSVERAVSVKRPAEKNGAKSGTMLETGSLPALSRREDQVLRLLAAGRATGEIADALQIKPVSARNHITRLMNKLGASTRLQAVAIGTRGGLL